jgi:tetratricopeptide (TPR) repeat protein
MRVMAWMVGCAVAAALWGGSVMADDNDEGAIRPQPKPAPAPRAEEEVAPKEPASAAPAEAVKKLAEAEQLYAEQDKPKEALRIAEPLVRDFERAQDWDHLVDALFLIGNAHYDLGEWKQGEAAMQRAHELGMQHFADSMGTGALKVIGECQYEQQNYDAALKTYQSRVDMLRQQGAAADQGDLAGALYDTAALLIDLDRAQEAVPLLDDAVKANTAHAAAQATGKAPQDEQDANATDRAEIVYLQAVAQFKLDQPAQTVPKLVEALGLFTAVHSTGRADLADRMVAVLDDLVLLYEQQGDAASAEKYRQQRDELNR